MFWSSIFNTAHIWNLILVTLGGGRQPEKERSSFRKLRLRFSMLSLPLAVLNAIFKIPTRSLFTSVCELESWGESLVGTRQRKKLRKEGLPQTATRFQPCLATLHCWTREPTYGGLPQSSSPGAGTARGNFIGNSNLLSPIELYMLQDVPTNSIMI